MIYFILAFLIVLADQASKYLVTLQFSSGGNFDIGNILRITYTTNSGGAFSMFSEHTMILAAVSAVVCILIIVLMITLKNSPMCRLSLGFILGGAIGNLIDRFVMGYVVDMFQPLFVKFAVFNVADIFITVGAVLFVISVIFFWPKKSNSEGVEEQGESDIPAPAPVSMDNYSRRDRRRVAKYGPDIDESTIVIPTDEIKARAEAVTPDPAGFDETVVVKRSSTNTDFSLEAESLGFELPDFSSDTSDEHTYTLEEIMKEYGDF